MNFNISISKMPVGDERLLKAGKERKVNIESLAYWLKKLTMPSEDWCIEVWQGKDTLTRKMSFSMSFWGSNWKCYHPDIQVNVASEMSFYPIFLKKNIFLKVSKYKSFSAKTGKKLIFQNVSCSL
ncbi:MAG: hypothetical protein K6F94_02815 [Bacteroidaceae bacterium]|nr:hypothetical protein [Bacteroidaceae bacterium]